jgi:hypothetical protein
VETGSSRLIPQDIQSLQGKANHFYGGPRRPCSCLSQKARGAASLLPSYHHNLLASQPRFPLSLYPPTYPLHPTHTTHSTPTMSGRGKGTVSSPLAQHASSPPVADLSHSLRLFRWKGPRQGRSQATQEDLARQHVCPSSSVPSQFDTEEFS